MSDELRIWRADNGWFVNIDQEEELVFPTESFELLVMRVKNWLLQKEEKE